jgi:hypothetical protein
LRGCPRSTSWSATPHENCGDELVVAASAGANLLLIGNSCDFDEDGGWLTINGEVHQYLSVGANDTDDPETITLADTLVASAAVETRVDVWDADNNTAVVEWVAHVILDGQTDGDAMPASADHALIPLLTQGIRAEGGESVTLECVAPSTRQSGKVKPARAARESAVGNLPRASPISASSLAVRRVLTLGRDA